MSSAGAQQVLRLIQLRQERPVSDGVNSYTGALSAEQVKNILAADSPLSDVADVGPTPTRYMVTVHNLRTHEQYMHPTPIDPLDKWYQYFLDRPIFRDINFLRADPFPPLAAPTHKAYTVQRMQLGDEWFAVIVNRVAPATVSLPTLDLDTVQVYLISPTLPSTFDVFERVYARTSQLRHAYAGHYAAGALAMGHGFKLSTNGAPPLPPALAADEDGYDIALLHGERLRDARTLASPARFAGTFVTTRVEANTGADVLPLVLQHARFLLPLLDADAPVDYDILQPHRYGYLFQLRSVAGWRIFGAVNMYATVDELESAFPEPFASRSASVPPFDERGTAVAGASPVFLQTLHGSIASALRQVEAAFLADFPTWRGTNPAAAAPWIVAGGPNIRALTTSAQKQQLPPHIWAHLFTHAGLRLIEKLVAPPVRAANQQTQIALGDAFLDAWLARRPIDLTPDLALVLFHMAHTLASISIVQFCNGAPPAALNSHALKDRLLGAAPTTVIPFDMARLTAAARALRGTPPSKWVMQLTLLFKFDALLLTQLLLHEPSTYASLLAADEGKLPAFLKGAKTFAPLIHGAFADTLKCAAAVLPLNQPAHRAVVTNALAYALLARADDRNGVAQWR